jgi:hypothetical protein
VRRTATVLDHHSRRRLRVDEHPQLDSFCLQLAAHEVADLVGSDAAYPDGRGAETAETDGHIALGTADSESK